MSLRFVQTTASTALFLSSLAAAPPLRAQTFEVASIKQNNSPSTTMKFPFPSGGRFTGTNLSLKTLISFAYSVQGFGIAGAPAWLNSDRYDVNAQAADTNVGTEQYRRMLQALLADRFKLQAHHESREAPIYAILPARNGSRLHEAREGSCVDGNLPRAAPQPGHEVPIVCGSFFTGPASLDVRKMSMSQIAGTLSILFGRPVVDKTGFTGTYDFHIEFSPEGVGLVPGRGAGFDVASAPDDTRPNIFTVLQQQLGLKLESQRAPEDVLIIDHLERVPREN
jgi:uncharacterized protein (TIGR03435 family)